MAKRKKTKKTTKKPYKHPLPSRPDILDFLRETGRPVSARAIARAFEVRSEKHREQLGDQLRKMVRSGQGSRRRV